MTRSIPRKPSKSAAVRARLDCSVIDTDLLAIEFAPALEDQPPEPEALDDERGALSEQNFKDLVFTHPYRFFAEKNPSFSREPKSSRSSRG